MTDMLGLQEGTRISVLDVGPLRQVPSGVPNTKQESSQRKRVYQQDADKPLFCSVESNAAERI